ncbi:MAG: hypothetical protein HKO56_00735 [Bacteroidia bacterium]|nr:hypothetical protein [Bacteroidia bacterium]NNC84529.1 hypothetical protein [Bacteroidia bacterium]NNM15151.1 hypothetical protein [Bacteroidia bacterium]
MSLVENIIGYFSKKQKGEDVKAPEGLCPNCWGKQEWDGKYIQLAEEKQIDVNNHAANHSFINEFVVSHLDGIRLKKEEQYYHCPTCSAKYHDHKEA